MTALRDRPKGDYPGIWYVAPKGSVWCLVTSILLCIDVSLSDIWRLSVLRCFDASQSSFLETGVTTVHYHLRSSCILASVRSEVDDGALGVSEL